MNFVLKSIIFIIKWSIVGWYLIRTRSIYWLKNCMYRVEKTGNINTYGDISPRDPLCNPGFISTAFYRSGLKKEPGEIGRIGNRIIFEFETQ